MRQMGGGRVRQGDIGNMPETSVESSRKKRDLQDEGRDFLTRGRQLGARVATHYDKVLSFCSAQIVYIHSGFLSTVLITHTPSA